MKLFVRGCGSKQAAYVAVADRLGPRQRLALVGRRRLTGHFRTRPSTYTTLTVSDTVPLRKAGRAETDPVEIQKAWGASTRF
jgi:hypothetical protein